MQFPLETRSVATWSTDQEHRLILIGQSQRHLQELQARLRREFGHLRLANTGSGIERLTDAAYVQGSAGKEILITLQNLARL